MRPPRHVRVSQLFGSRCPRKVSLHTKGFVLQIFAVTTFEGLFCHARDLSLSHSTPVVVGRDALTILRAVRVVLRSPLA